MMKKATYFIYRIIFAVGYIDIFRHKSRSNSWGVPLRKMVFGIAHDNAGFTDGLVTYKNDFMIFASALHLVYLNNGNIIVWICTLGRVAAHMRARDSFVQTS